VTIVPQVPIIRPVRSFLLAFLMLFLPLQWSTAAVAQYCLHEPDAAAQRHVGHHDHKHEDAAHDQRDDGKTTFHPDCATCVVHVVCAPCAQVSSVASEGSAQVFAPYLTLIPQSVPDDPFRPPLVILA